MRYATSESWRTSLSVSGVTEHRSLCEVRACGGRLGGPFSADSTPVMTTLRRAAGGDARRPLYDVRMASRRLPFLRAAVRGLRRRRRAAGGRRGARRRPAGGARSGLVGAARAPADADRGALAPAGRALRRRPGGLVAARSRRSDRARRAALAATTRRCATTRRSRRRRSRSAATSRCVLITARAPVGAPLLHVTALLADGTPRSLGDAAAEGELGHVRVQRGRPRRAAACASCSIP